MQGLGLSMNTYNGPVPPGVPNPFTVMLHSYPTRYHGPIYTRPMYDLPWAERPNDFGVQPQMNGLGFDTSPADVTIQPMEPWKVAVGIAAAVGIVYVAMHLGGPRRVRA